MSVSNLNKGLKIYYENLGVEYNDIFVNWYNDNEFDENDIKQEFEGKSNDATVIEFDIDNNENNLFPLKYQTNDEHDRNELIFEIMKYCYYNGIPPNNPSNKKVKIHFIYY